MNNRSAGLADKWDAQKKRWALLKGLHPSVLDLSRVALIRGAEPAALRQPGALEALLLDLGLNDEGMNELPVHLHPYCGPGLRVWQYPIQFAPYLRYLSRLQVRSYLEIGIRHGGSYIVTVEVLNQFSTLDRAVGVDIIPCPSMDAYASLNSRSEFACLNTQSPEFEALLDRLAPVDLAFIDSHHEEEQCRREFQAVRRVARMVALHDIANDDCPGVRTVWTEIKALGEYDCLEFVDQYGGLGPFMGIGLAVRKDRRQTGS